MRGRFVVAILALGACGDPQLRCPGDPLGTYVRYGQSCARSRPITVDGHFEDWANIPSNQRPCADCTQGEVIAIHLTHTTDTRLAVYVETMGTPNTDARHSYLVEIAPLDGPYYSTAMYVQPTMVTRVINDVAVSGLPIDVAFGDTGVELALPRDSLPFSGGAVVEFSSLEVMDGTWSGAQNIVPAIAYACWDKTSPVCQPL